MLMCIFIDSSRSLAAIVCSRERTVVMKETVKDRVTLFLLTRRQFQIYSKEVCRWDTQWSSVIGHWEAIMISNWSMGTSVFSSITQLGFTYW